TTSGERATAHAPSSSATSVKNMPRRALTGCRVTRFSRLTPIRQMFFIRHGKIVIAAAITAGAEVEVRRRFRVDGCANGRDARTGDWPRRQAGVEIGVVGRKRRRVIVLCDLWPPCAVLVADGVLHRRVG